MRKFSYLMLLVAVAFSACTNEAFKKAKDGTQYKIIKSNSGKKLFKGDFMELNTVVTYKDSVLFSSYEKGMPQFAPYDTTNFPPLYKEIFKDIYVGDSVIIKIPTDTLIKKGEGAPFMLKGQFITQAYKIENLYKTQEQSDSAYKTHVEFAKAIASKKAIADVKKNIATTWAHQLKIDDKILKDYLAEKGITASKSDWGTYVSITSPGTGEKLTEKDVAVVNYTGKTMQDSVFDSNVDPKFNHIEPYNVDLSKFNVIPGWIDGLKMLSKGCKATIYIPSSLAYGTNGRQPQIKPNDNLIFNMEVVDVLTAAQNDSIMTSRQKEAAAKRQKMMEENMKKSIQRRDSLANVKKLDSIAKAKKK